MIPYNLQHNIFFEKIKDCRAACEVEFEGPRSRRIQNR